MTTPEAYRLISKWKDEAASVLFIAKLRAFSVSIENGRISDFTENFLTVTTSSGPSSATLSLSEVSAFVFEEATEISRATLTAVLVSQPEKVFFMVQSQ